MNINLKVIGFVGTATIIFFFFMMGMFFWKGWFEPTYLIYAKFSNIQNLNKNSDVKIQSIKTGKVKDFELADDGATMVICLEIKSEFKHLIRRDSKVNFGFKMTLQGGDLFISGGSADQAALNHGDTLVGENPLDLSKLATQANRLLNGLDSIITRLERGQGTAGALLKDRDVVDQVSELLGNADRLMAKGNLIFADLKRVAGESEPALDTVKILLSKLRTVTDSLPDLLASGKSLIKNTDNLIDNVTVLVNQAPSILDQGEEALDNANDLLAGARNSFLLGRFFQKNNEDPILLLE
ncbi:MAG: MlaD family protein [bacterium]